MLLFCSTMHFASGRVRRKTSQFVPPERYVFREISSNRTGCSQNCVSPVIFGFRFKIDLTAYYHLDTRKPMVGAHHLPTHRRSSTSRTLAPAKVGLLQLF